MGAVSPEHVDVAVWREAHADVVTMLRYGWTVTATCATCALRVGVRLTIIARVCGPATVHWGRPPGLPTLALRRLPGLWFNVTEPG